MILFPRFTYFPSWLNNYTPPRYLKLSPGSRVWSHHRFSSTINAPTLRHIMRALRLLPRVCPIRTTDVCSASILSVIVATRNSASVRPDPFSTTLHRHVIIIITIFPRAPNGSLHTRNVLIYSFRPSSRHRVLAIRCGVIMYIVL